MESQPGGGASESRPLPIFVLAMGWGLLVVVVAFVLAEAFPPAAFLLWPGFAVGGMLFSEWAAIHSTTGIVAIAMANWVIYALLVAIAVGVKRAIR